MRSGRLLVVAACLVPLVSCSRDAGEETRAGGIGRIHGALAQVNRAELREDVLQRLIPPDLSESITGAEIREILERWVETELLYQKARREGLDHEPEVAEVLRQMHRRLLADELLQREMQARVHVTKEEIRAYYDAHREQYTQELHLRHIVLNTPEEAQEVLEQLRGGASFKALARKHSTDPTASRGGDLGFLAKGAMNPAFEAVVFDMEPSELRGPVASSFGFHIVQLAGSRRSSRPVSFEAARDEIMQRLLLEKQQRAHRELLAELRRQAEVHMATSYAGMSLLPEDAAPAVPDSTAGHADSTETLGTR
ncbi:MAG: peptidylprolyl isomerase [Candidatus Krumholzibacteriia bacterium]